MPIPDKVRAINKRFAAPIHSGLSCKSSGSGIFFGDKNPNSG
jgi:hypothetical protein